MARRWPYLLTASLALNLFLVGLIGSAWIQREARQDMRRSNPLVAMWSPEALRSLDRDLAREVWERHRGTTFPRFRAIGEARREADQLLGQPQFDSEAYAAALAELRARTEAAQAAMHDAIVDFVERLPPEDRAHLAEHGPRRWRSD